MFCVSKKLFCFFMETKQYQIKKLKKYFMYIFVVVVSLNFDGNSGIIFCNFELILTKISRFKTKII